MRPEELPAFRPLVEYMTGKTPQVIRTCWLKFNSVRCTKFHHGYRGVDRFKFKLLLVLNPRILVPMKKGKTHHV